MQSWKISKFYVTRGYYPEDINCDDEESETDNESTANLDDVDEEEIERLKQQVMSAEDLPDAPSSDECDDESISADSLESV